MALALAAAFLYVTFDIRGPSWKEEKGKYIGAQIRKCLITLVPKDLEVTSDEQQRLANSEIYKELTGVFWETIDNNEVLRNHKEHFYSNGFVYSTAIDVFLLCLTFGFCYLITWLIFRNTFFLYFGGTLIAVSLIARSLAIPRARQQHLRLSTEQLDLLKRESGDFVAQRFRKIVEDWRAKGRSSVNTVSLPPKNLAFRKDAIAGICLIAAVSVLELVARGILAQPPPEVKSAYITADTHHKPIAVVFVHGIFGSKEDTWLSPSHVENFPRLLATDPDLKDKVDVFAFEYFTPKFGAAPSIVDLSNQLRGELEDHHIFEDHQKIVFLAHSMGGLIVRLFLLQQQDVIAKVPMIFFYATPTNGAEIASIATLALQNPQLRGMAPLESNDFLQSIQSQWLSSNKAEAIASHCGIETLPTFGIMVVTRSSATSLCNRGFDSFSSNHMDIVKPADRTDSRYTRFVTALRKEVLDNSASKISETAFAEDGHKRKAASKATNPTNQQIRLGNIHQGPCSNLQIGGSSNQQSTNCQVLLPAPSITLKTKTNNEDGTQTLVYLVNIVGDIAPAHINIHVKADGLKKCRIVPHQEGSEGGPGWLSEGGVMEGNIYSETVSGKARKYDVLITAPMTIDFGKIHVTADFQ